MFCNGLICRSFDGFAHEGVDNVDKGCAGW